MVSNRIIAFASRLLSSMSDNSALPAAALTPVDPTPTVRLVSVAYNPGAQTVRECLESVADAAAASQGEYAIERFVIVDNASTDGSLSGIEAAFAPRADVMPLEIVRNDRNRGFGTASNQGAHGSPADFLLFLNLDTRSYPNALARAVAFMNAPENATVGVAGVRLVGDDGKPGRACARYPTARHFWNRLSGLHEISPARFPIHAMTEWDHEESRAVDHVMGAFYLIRRDLFEKLGGFDEKFFVFFEDLDLSRRVAGAGYSVQYLADAAVFHQFGHTSDQIKATRLFLSLCSRVVYARKYFSRPAALGIHAASLTLEPLLRLARALVRRSPREAREVATAHARFAVWSGRGGR